MKSLNRENVFTVILNTMAMFALFVVLVNKSPKMTKCPESNFKLNGIGVCPNCGVVVYEHTFVRENYYPYDDENVTHYGDPKTISVSNIALMTKVNTKGFIKPDLRRALGWDEKYGWDIKKIEIVNHEIKKICKNLGIINIIRDYWMFLFINSNS